MPAIAEGVRSDHAEFYLFGKRASRKFARLDPPTSCRRGRRCAPFPELLVANRGRLISVATEVLWNLVPITPPGAREWVYEVVPPQDER
jgi:hypothetical protein